ncbi:MAG: 3-keto-5-aminohexanoate cleavage protein [Deltaproteobacteria bacterium]|nr:3-keto-5-aminohexanoate cleavage protein [Deltaproteobacteria bacterium]MBW1914291.1 3-keto-5-aminohexanoate cleavage protein [Deltaproteobacteria bacterium]
MNSIFFFKYSSWNLATNQQLVARAVRIVKELGKIPFTPDEAGDILGLK